MLFNDVQTVSTEAAFKVLARHLKALNSSDENELAKTLHFPHYRLVGSKLDCWQSPENYFTDFRERAGKSWERTEWGSIEVMRASCNKVHLKVQVNRFDNNSVLLADFDSLWIVTKKDDMWAVQIRSSFAFV